MEKWLRRWRLLEVGARHVVRHVHDGFARACAASGCKSTLGHERGRFRMKHREDAQQEREENAHARDDAPRRRTDERK
jgi:hypothetical protein